MNENLSWNNSGLGYYNPIQPPSLNYPFKINKLHIPDNRIKIIYNNKTVGFSNHVKLFNNKHYIYFQLISPDSFTKSKNYQAYPKIVTETLVCHICKLKNNKINKCECIQHSNYLIIEEANLEAIVLYDKNKQINIIDQLLEDFTINKFSLLEQI